MVVAGLGSMQSSTSLLDCRPKQWGSDPQSSGESVCAGNLSMSSHLGKYPDKWQQVRRHSALWAAMMDAPAVHSLIT